MRTQTCDICVVGAGSGGFGTALAAARSGAAVLLFEAAKGVGGTSTWAGVNNYEPVAGATGLPQEVYERLRILPGAVVLQRRRRQYDRQKPWGFYDHSRHTDYRLSLSRHSHLRQWRPQYESRQFNDRPRSLCLGRRRL